MLNVQILANQVKWIHMGLWLPWIVLIILFMVGFSLGWIRGGIATLFFFAVNFISIIILNLINEPFKKWLLHDVSVFNYASWVIYRIGSPLILIIGGLAVVNAVTWMVYALLLRKKFIQWSNKLPAKKRNVINTVGGLISGVVWIFIGMMPLFAFVPVAENEKEVRESAVGRTMETFYAPMSFHDDLLIVSEYKEFFSDLYDNTKVSINTASCQDGALGTICKAEVIFDTIFTEIENQPRLFGNIKGTAQKTIAEIKAAAKDYATSGKPQEYINKTSELLREKLGIPISADLINDLLNKALG